MHARFFREAELAGALRHPNITEVYESGIEGDTPFIVQELLAGEDLSGLIARREPARRVKLMDFGIARLLGSSTNLTKSGIGVGSIGYMSPEQVSGDPVDERSDLFGLGVPAYELLSFRPPIRTHNLV